jgi:ubiquitin fusion degradation protein 1
MLFELSGSQGRVTHCGVLEFVADEGLCYLPHWVDPCFFYFWRQRVR